MPQRISHAVSVWSAGIPASFRAFAGPDKKLADLHINNEPQPECPPVRVEKLLPNWRVETVRS